FVGEREPRARPEANGRTGCAASAAAFWSRINDAKSKTRGRNATGRHYNSSTHHVKHAGYGSASFAFATFEAPYRGPYGGSSGQQRHPLRRLTRVSAMLSRRSFSPSPP